jgi:hypothetical protein
MKPDPPAVCVAPRRRKPTKHGIKKQWAEFGWKAVPQPALRPGSKPADWASGHCPVPRPDSDLSHSHLGRCRQSRSRRNPGPSRHRPSRRLPSSKAHRSQPTMRRAFCASPRHGVQPEPRERPPSTGWDSYVRRECARIGPFLKRTTKTKLKQTLAARYAVADARDAPFPRQRDLQFLILA